MKSPKKRDVRNAIKWKCANLPFYCNRILVKYTRKIQIKFSIQTLWLGKKRKRSSHQRWLQGYCFKACNFIKKETLAQVFSCEYCEISKNTIFTENLWATASWESSIKESSWKSCPGLSRIKCNFGADSKCLSYKGWRNGL